MSKSEAGSCFLKQETVIVPSKGEGFPWETPMRSYWAVPNKHSRGTPCPLSEREQNSRYFSRYYATIRSWKHMEDGFFVLWHEIGKSTEHCMLSFYWQTLSTWETSVLFSCSQGKRGPTFSVLCTFCCFPVGGQGCQKWTESCFISPQASLMAISEGSTSSREAPAQQTDSSLLLCLDISGSACYLHLHTKAW